MLDKSACAPQNKNRSAAAAVFRQSGQEGGVIKVNCMGFFLFYIGKKTFIAACLKACAAAAVKTLGALVFAAAIGLFSASCKHSEEPDAALNGTWQAQNGFVITFDKGKWTEDGRKGTYTASAKDSKIALTVTQMLIEEKWYSKKDALAKTPDQADLIEQSFAQMTGTYIIYDQSLTVNWESGKTGTDIFTKQ